MTIYWLLFAFPALLAFAFPLAEKRGELGAPQHLAFNAFILFYVLVAALRQEVGGDWLAYLDIYDSIQGDTLLNAVTVTDPLFGILNWISSKLDAGVYLVNGVCAWILAVGTVRVALNQRDPWLAITMAVPYLLVVVGMGYVRQGAAIGLLLIAIATFNKSSPMRTLSYLVMAIGFHSTAIIVVPLFAYAMTARYKIASVFLASLGAAAFFFVLAPRLEGFEAGYLEADYDSSGTLARLLMSVLPSALLLLRSGKFALGERARTVWISMAFANLAALLALQFVSSSTAIDRIALFFAPIQMVVFGAFREIIPLPDRAVIPLRFVLIGVAAVVQVIWLVFATNAEYWVPYQSILQSP